MRRTAIRFLPALVPVMVVLGWTGEARAQNAWGLGVGVGYGSYWGRGFGPYWGPAWGLFPTHYPGFWGNGLSLYGPPVPTGKPIPGYFGGADADLFYYRGPRVYPGFGVGVYKTVGVGGPVVGAPPGAMIGPGGEVLPPPGLGPAPGPAPAPELDKPAAFEVEVRLPREDAKLFIDGQEAPAAGAVRKFATEPRQTAELFSYDLRAEWTEGGQVTTLTRRIHGRPGEKSVVEFK